MYESQGVFSERRENNDTQETCHSASQCGEGKRGKITEEDATRFWSKVNKDGPLPDQSNPHYAGLDKCWEWTAALGTKGYGLININHAAMKAHHVAFALANPDIDRNGMCVLHACDNRKCCNSKHLFLGTYDDNNKDRAAKSRGGKTRNTAGKPQKQYTCKTRGNRISSELANQIRAAYPNRTESLAKFAAKYGVSAMTVWKIGNNKTHAE